MKELCIEGTKEGHIVFLIKVHEANSSILPMKGDDILSLRITVNERGAGDVVVVVVQ